MKSGDQGRALLQDFPHLGLKFGHIISRVKVSDPLNVLRIKDLL